MSLNVDFLKKFPQWQSLHESASEAENNVFTKPRTSLFYSRVTLERAVRWLYSNDDYLQYPAKDKPMLGDLIHEQTFQENLSPGMLGPLKLIIKLGNLAVHTDEPMDSDKSLLIFEHLFMFLNWLQRYYGTPKIKDLAFNELMIPVAESGQVSRESLPELTKLEEKISAKDALLAEAQAEILTLRRQLAETSIQPQETREPKPRIILSPRSEAKTRQLLIDVMLREAKWDPRGENVEEFEVSGMPNRSSVGYCDYVLWSDKRTPLAVIEVKSTVHDAKKGKKQAEIYASNLEKMYGVRPLIFYSNGYHTYLWDDTYYPPREVATFYRKDELEWVIQRRNNKKPLISIKPDQRIAGRVYQIDGIRRVGEAYEGARRHALMVMATGTGKTRTAIALIDFLKRAGWVKNVLFLADRRELVKQAYGEFKKHLPNETVCNLLEDKRDISARLYFSTYQTMAGFLHPKKGNEVPFGIAHFDLIIVDEAHRSIYNKFGTVFQYFDALLLGLTATPKSEVDRDTYDFFKLQRNLPTHAYEYEQAIEEKHLVPVKPVKVKFKFMHDGIDPEELSESEREDYNNRIRLLKGKKVEKDALNSWLFNKNTVKQALDLLMQKGIKVAGGDKLGKTIIFARNQKHAEFIVEMFDEMYPNLRGKFMTTIHNKVDYADKLIEEFKQGSELPQIAVSVDMLDTGIDVPEVVNLVLFRPVFSFSKFWQMIGRGTRLCENLFGPNQHKTHALLFDMCGNVEYFDAFQEGEDEGSKVISLSEQLFEQRSELIYELHKTQQYPDLMNATISYVTNQLEQMDEHHFTIRPHLSTVIKYRQSENWISLSEGIKAEVISTLAPIVYEDVTEEKKRFDLLMLRLQRSVLGVTSIGKRNSYINKLISIGTQLLTKDKQNIKEIKDHLPLLKKITTTEFYNETNVSELEHVRLVVRELLALLDTEQRTILYTNFTDELQSDEEVDLPKSSDFSAYRKHVCDYIFKHQDHIAIQKLRKNKPITGYDVSSFASMLFNEQIGTQEQFEKLFGGKGAASFGSFVRELIGLEQDAAQEAFANLLSKTNLNPNQIHFINLIIEYLTKNGNLDPGKLMDEPFIHLHQEGVYGMFEEAEVDEIVQVVRYLQNNAKINDVS
ncbi:DEAD/DEAH box helicase family protein [Paenibacillus sp. CGMCC 1.16610]|uniref:DEAD/DEAH box helicase family protein n=1 Tax=Paenibacillus TaxID=44249 RepID=UPI0015EE6B4E|nr:MULTISPECIES: DEAD/DEAH box helicase family protein [Paenibacillus]MBA2938212.1 DEAD/DEAH box helicase family protein [Paenibacillus sp. CGMCC 1.16610]